MPRIKLDLYDQAPETQGPAPMPSFGGTVDQPTRMPDMPTSYAPNSGWNTPGQRFPGFDIGNTQMWGNYNPTSGGQNPFQPQQNIADPQAAFRNLMQGFGYGHDALSNAKSALQQMGIDVPTDASGLVRGDLILPGGRRVRVVDPREGKTEWNNWKTNPMQGGEWQWNDMGIDYGALGMGSYFNDPMLAQFASFGQDAIAQLMQPQSMHPVLADAIGKLNQMFASRDAGFSTFKPIADQRLAQLQEPAWTDAQRSMIQTNFREPVVQGRDAAQQRALNRASTRGLGLGSGVLEQEARGIDDEYAQILGEGDRQLAIQEIAANEARQQEAVQIGQMLGNLRNAGAGTGLSASGQLAGIGSQLQQEPTQRLMQALGISQNLAMLPGQQMAMALSAMNSLGNQQVPQADPTSGLVSLLLALAGQGEGAYQNALGQEGSFWENLFGAIPGLLNAFPTTGNTGSTQRRRPPSYWGPDEGGE